MLYLYHLAFWKCSFSWDFSPFTKEPTTFSDSLQRSVGFLRQISLTVGTGAGQLAAALTYRALTAISAKSDILTRVIFKINYL